MTNYRIHQYELLIREYHLDTFGHVNNATYLSILEEARWELVTAHDMGLEKIRKSGSGFVVLEIHIQFIKELKLREKVVIETQLESMDSKVSTLKQTIKNEKGNICCQATLKVALFDLINRKILPPTDEWKALMV